MSEKRDFAAAALTCFALLTPLIAKVIAAGDDQLPPLPDSDLNNEQPISLHVRMTLGELRQARRAMRALEKASQ